MNRSAPSTLGVALPPGTIRPVVVAPAEVLSKRCEEVDPAAPEIVELAADLVATMAVSPGCVGLAANQIGHGLRVFSLNVVGHPKTRTTHGAFVLCNPRIVAASRNVKGREGCMSVPDWTGDVKRATRIEVVGQLPISAEEVVFRTDGFEAVAIQHEIDHLDGALFLDRLVDARALHRRVVYQ